MENLQTNNNAELQNSDGGCEWEKQINDLTAKNSYGYFRTRNEIHYGPPPNWNKPIPNHAMEVFIGALPRDVNVYELVSIIDKELEENCIYELSIMLDLTQHFTNDPNDKSVKNRGFAFVTFKSKEYAEKCREILDKREIRSGKHIRINPSTPNLHLFVANVPSGKGRDDILRDLREYTDGLKDVIIFAAKTGTGEMDTKRHRGFIFLEYDTHAAAANARKKLSKPGFRLWNRELKVDWAAKKQEPSAEVMSKVKSIYIRNLTAECTDQNLKEHFSQYGEIDSIKKVRDFAFIHFKDRKSAVAALDSTNKTVLPDNLSNGTIDVEMVKPNIHNANQQYKSMMMMNPMAAALGFPPFGGIMPPPPPNTGSSGSHHGPPPPFLPYPPPPPYGLPMPPPPHHHSHHHHPHSHNSPGSHMMHPPPPPPPHHAHHLMYGSPNSGYHFPGFKGKSWNYMNGSKHNYYNSYRYNKSNKNDSANNNGHNSGTNGNSGNSANVGASGDNSNNNSSQNNNTSSSPNNGDQYVPYSYDINKRLKSFKQPNLKNPQALFYLGMSNNEMMYRDSPFMGW